MELQGPELAPVWDADAAGGSFTCYAIAPAPACLWNVSFAVQKLLDLMYSHFSKLRLYCLHFLRLCLCRFFAVSIAIVISWFSS